MKLNTIFVVSAVIYIIYGIAIVLIPGLLIALYGGMPMERPTELLFGAFLIGFAVLNWFARNAEEGGALRAIILANLVTGVISLLMSLYLVLSGMLNAVGWSVVVIFLLFTLGYGYFLLMGPRATVASTPR